jgi:uncharacterized repeat protein (TIGR04138 family)
MSKLNFNEVVDQICAQDNRYDTEAYTFVREGLDHTLKSLKRSANSTHRHVTGQELLNGLRDHALKEYGPMSKAVLNEWGIRTCEDFGNIVFNLVNSSILGKTDADSPNDFKNGFNFDEAFVKPFEPRRDHVSGRKAAPHARSGKRSSSSKKSSAGSL